MYLCYQKSGEGKKKKWMAWKCWLLKTWLLWRTWRVLTLLVLTHPVNMDWDIMWLQRTASCILCSLSSRPSCSPFPNLFASTGCFWTAAEDTIYGHRLSWWSLQIRVRLGTEWTSRSQTDLGTWGSHVSSLSCRASWPRVCIYAIPQMTLNFRTPDSFPTATWNPILVLMTHIQLLLALSLEFGGVLQTGLATWFFGPGAKWKCKPFC